MHQDSEKLIKLLEDSVGLYKKDRELAIENYNMLKSQLKEVTKIQDYSEEAKLEKEVNNALQNVFKSGQRLDAVIQTLAKIIINSMHAQAKVESAKAFNGMLTNEKIVSEAIDISKLLAEPETIEYN